MNVCTHALGGLSRRGGQPASQPAKQTHINYSITPFILHVLLLSICHHSALSSSSSSRLCDVIHKPFSREWYVSVAEKYVNKNRCCCLVALLEFNESNSNDFNHKLRAKKRQQKKKRKATLSMHGKISMEFIFVAPGYFLSDIPAIC